MAIVNHPHYGVTSLKTFNGLEGQGFSANLTYDGRKVAEVIDDANGGCFHYHWVDKAAEKALADYAATLPSVESYGMMLDYNADMVVDEVVIYEQARRQFKRLYANKVMFMNPDDTTIRTLLAKYKPTEQVLTSFAKQRPDARILNRLPFDEALALFIQHG